MSTAYIVDDEYSIRTALRRLLEMHGVTTQAYASAETFLVDVANLKTGCLVLDINMPGLNGLDLLKRLRSENCHLPVVLMTGRVDAALTDQAMQAGAFALLEKPLDVDVLLSNIDQALAHSADVQNPFALIADPNG